MTFSPVVEVFIGRDREAWRLYTHGWVPPHVRQKLDRHGEAFPVNEPDLQELERFTFALDAPYAKHVVVSGAIQIAARGRSAIVFGEWLDGIISTANP